MGLFAYILSISFQVTGALLLVIFAVSTKRMDIIKSFASSHMIFKDGSTGKLYYNNDAFIDTFRKAYYSKISVGFIAAGYLLGVFGDAGQTSRWCVALMVIGITAAQILIIKSIVERIVRRENVQRELTNDELMLAGVEPDIESLSTDEIETILNEENEEDM